MSEIKQKYFKTVFKKTAIAIACASVSTLAIAAESAEAQTDVQSIERISITGSNIRRNRDIETPSPIETVDMKDIESAGVGQMQDLIKMVPAMAGSDLAGSREAQGTSQFSLRGLGVAGTLTLINGRRAGLSPISTSQGFFFTDINQYPTNMIQSVEVLKDGASATYGSDAVGGVVNIITRKNFEGLEIGGEYRDNEVNPAQNLNLALGHKLDKGHFSMFVNYYEQDGGARGEYDWLVKRSKGDSFNASENQYDSSTGAGRYSLATQNPDDPTRYLRSSGEVADPYCGEPSAATGITQTFVDGNNCRYIFLNQRALIGSESRLQAFAQFDYEISDDTTVFAEMSFSSNEVNDIIGGAPLDVRTDDGGFYVPSDHPFNYFVDDGSGGIEWDEAAVAADPSAAVDVIFRGRPLTNNDGDYGEDIEKNFENSRIVLGFDTFINDEWSLYGSYMYAHSLMTDVLPRNYNGIKFREAIGSGRWNPFSIGWADPTATSVKDGVTTAGNDVYGPYTESDLGQFASYRTFVRESNQQAVELTLSGMLFELDGLEVVGAFGVQYRSMEYTEIADSSQVFLQGGYEDYVFSINGATQDTIAVYGEVIVPVTEDLEVQVALRYEDYGDGEGGDTTDPKVGIRWQATDMVQLRGSYGTSFQAPSVRNIAGAGGGGSFADPITQDVFNGGQGSSCDPDINDTFNITTTTLGGNLKPQTATNFNLGIVLTDDEAFTVSADYWNYDYEDLIGAGQSAASILADECSRGSYTPDDRVTRDATGQATSIVNAFTNLGGVTADGVDITANYAFDQVFGGELVLNTSITYINSYDIDSGDGSPKFDGANNRNTSFGQLGSVPDTRVNIGVDWHNEQHSVSFYVRHIGGYDDRTPNNDYESIDSFTVFDSQYSFNTSGLIGEGTTSLSIGVNNLTDEEPPAIDRNSSNGRRAFDSLVHDPRGRTIYARFKHSF
ncbi:MAG: TonB-dependent receptor [Colwellia sp.]|nr:TonB-dependent receptor [Colwellia sp.]